MIAGIVNKRAALSPSAPQTAEREYAETDITESLVVYQIVQPPQGPACRFLPDLRISSEIEGDPAVALGLRTVEPITIPE
jgi:hypothetical protein